MQGISTSLPSFNKMPYSNEKESKESRQNICELRENPLPITVLQKQIVEHINEGKEKIISGSSLLNNRDRTIRSIHEPKKDDDLITSTAEELRTSISDPVLFSHESVEEPNTQKVSEKNASFIIDDAGQKRIIRFLNRNGIENNYSSNQAIGKELLIADLAKYLYKTDSGDETQDKRNRKLARVILANANLYGGVKGEYISPEMAKTVIKEWLFHQVLADSLEKNIVNEIASSKSSSDFTVSSIKSIFDIDYLVKKGKVNIQNLDEEQNRYFRIMWGDYLKDEFPFIDSQDDKVRTMLLKSQDFADLYAGYKYVNNMGKLAEHSLDDITEIGRALWNMAFSEGVSIDNIGFYILPSFIIMVDKIPSHYDSDKDFLNFKIETVDKYIKYQRNVIELQKDFIDKYNDFTTHLSSWISRRTLADSIVNDCITSDEILTKGDKYQERKDSLESGDKIEEYLNGTKPCDKAPEDIDKEYERLTSIVSDKLNVFNELLMTHALSSVKESEFDFISSVGAKFDLINFSMAATTSPVVVGPGLVNPGSTVNVKLNNADLFSVTVGDEERVYALKKDANSLASAYEVVRVDRNIDNYIKSGLLSESFNGDYKIKDNKVIYGLTYIYDFSKNGSSIDVDGQGWKGCVKYFNNKFSGNYHKQLFEAGYDKTSRQKLLDILKGFIPFYTCIEGAINKGDPGEYIPSCYMDALTMIPVAGFAVSLVGKFGMGLGRGIHMAGKSLARGSLIAAGKTLIRNVITPTQGELATLARLLLKAADPGFELLVKSGRFPVKN